MSTFIIPSGRKATGCQAELK